MATSRRDFLRSAVGLAAFGAGGAAAGEAAESLPTRKLIPPGHPVVVASDNGLPACNRAMELLKAAADPLDAAVAGVTVVEDDPNDHSVGYGGLPNEDGVVELDACVMHGPSHKAGAVAALQNIRNPAGVARLVMRHSDHVLLVGSGALRFALAHGFQEQDLLTDEAREIWLKWKEERSGADDRVPPESGDQAAERLRDRGLPFTYGTITCLALTTGGDLGGSTSTSGRSYKLPGRVGDSPIIGAGLYIDNEVGACGSTGRGEANLLNCTCFHVVELMRAGATPADACRTALMRVAARTEARLRDQRGEPDYQLKLYALRRDGVFGGFCMRDEKGQIAVHDGQSGRLVPLPGLFAGRPQH